MSKNWFVYLNESTQYIRELFAFHPKYKVSQRYLNVLSLVAGIQVCGIFTRFYMNRKIQHLISHH